MLKPTQQRFCTMKAPGMERISAEEYLSANFVLLAFRFPRQIFIPRNWVRIKSIFNRQDQTLFEPERTEESVEQVLRLLVSAVHGEMPVLSGLHFAFACNSCI